MSEKSAGSAPSAEGARSVGRRWKPYPEYKDPGVEWLGKVPVGWGLKRLRRVVAFQGGGTPTRDNLGYWRGDIPWVSPKDMKVSVILDSEDKITAQALRESATKMVPSGAVLIVVRSGILVHSIPVAIAGREVTLNQDLKALIPNVELVPEYLMYLISGMQRELLVEWRKEGATVESLELELVANTLTPLPGIEEQRPIAAFLDREMARIDALVAKKERLIELLHEKREALTTQAVTRGMRAAEASASYSSGSDPLPAGWREVRLKFVSGGITVGVVVNPSHFFSDSGLPFLRGVDVQPGKILLADVKFISAADNRRHSKSILRADDVVAVRDGVPGTAAVVPRELDGANCVSLLIIRRSARFASRFVCYSMNSKWGKEQIRGLREGAALGHVNVEALKEFIIRLPSIAEQRAIAAFLDRETAKIDALVAKVREAIALLKEYRTALISAAVTGKIDVREEAA